MCDKIRLMQAGALMEDYRANLGKGFDLWVCQYLGADYVDLAQVVREGASDEEALLWCQEHGSPCQEPVKTWWLSYMRNRGYGDELSEKLVWRKEEAGLGDRDEVVTFMDFIDAEEGR